MLPSYEQFINEADNYMLVSKRKRGENPMETISTKSPIRTKVLEFVSSKGFVTEKELVDFISSLSEEVGFNPSPSWVKRNLHYFNVKEQNGEKTFKLSERGKRIHETVVKFNSLKEKLKDEVKAEIAGKRPRINDEKDFDEILSGGKW